MSDPRELIESDTSPDSAVRRITEQTDCGSEFERAISLIAGQLGRPDLPGGMETVKNQIEDRGLDADPEKVMTAIQERVHGPSYIRSNYSYVSGFHRLGDNSTGPPPDMSDWGTDGSSGGKGTPLIDPDVHVKEYDQPAGFTIGDFMIPQRSGCPMARHKFWMQLLYGLASLVGPDTRGKEKRMEMAEKFGVKQETIAEWLRTGKEPNPNVRKRIKEAYKEHVNIPNDYMSGYAPTERGF